VHADDPLRPVPAVRDRGDRERGGVGRQHSIIAGDGAEAVEQLAFQLQVLGSGLDDQVAVRQAAELAGRGQPAQSRHRLLDAPAPALHALLDRVDGPVEAAEERLRVGVVQPRLHAAQGSDLGDSSAHRPGAHHPDRTHRARAHRGGGGSSPSQNGTESRS
jgi:hypothetical protein